MQLKYKALRLAFVASVAISGVAAAQTTPPADNQSQTPSQNPPGPVNPQDQSTVASPQAGTAETTGVAGGVSGGRKKAEEEIVVTGSRVRRKDLTTPAPVTVINKEQIQSSGIAAIGGVVNIITRRRVNGVELSAYGATSQHGDAQQYDISVTGGAAGEKGSFMFSAGYFDQKSMLAAKRDWATFAVGLDAGGN